MDSASRRSLRGLLTVSSFMLAGFGCGAAPPGDVDEGSGADAPARIVGALNAEALPPSVSVMPVILVPSGVGQPSTAEKNELMLQLTWAQQRYSQMLGAVDTFSMAQTTVSVVNDTNHNAAFYAAMEKGIYRNNDPEAVKVVLNSFGKDRFNNPYIYCIVVKGTAGGGGGGVTMNGGTGAGGGYMIFRGDVLLKNAQGQWKVPNFQSSLRHELGHTFGLLHSWEAYGDDLPRYAADTGDSVMSYNLSHQTGPNHQEAPSAGILLPEEIRELSLNKRVFANLTFDPTTAIPANYGLRSPGGWFGEEDEMPGASRLSVAGTTVSSNQPAAFSSQIGNILSDPVAHPLAAADAVYNASRMFHTGVISDADGWVSIEVFFPSAQALNAVGIHTGYGASDAGASDGVHRADAVEVHYYDSQGTRQLVAARGVSSEDKIRFAEHPSSHWQIFLHSAEPAAPRYLVVRGLTFHGQAGSSRASVYSAFEDTSFGSTVANAVQGTIVPPSSPFDPFRMWHSAPADGGGWTSMVVEFPYAVPLNGLGVHSSYAGPTHPADRVEVGVLDANNVYSIITEQPVGIDDAIGFPETTSKRWMFWFHSSSATPYIVLRGLTFLTQQGEVFPPSYPREKLNYLTVAGSSGEDFSSRALHAVTGVIPGASAAYDPATMWHSTSLGANGWAYVDVTFPYAVSLVGVTVHTQYGASVHRAQSVEVQYKSGSTFTSKGTKTGLAADDSIIFSTAQAARIWRVRLRATASGYVVVRGLEFLSPSAVAYPDQPARILYYTLSH